MEKKSKVSLAAFKRSWTGKYGEMFDHDVSFENGDTGVYSSKSQNQDKFVVGQEADYTIDSSNPEFPAKIKPVNTFQQSNNSNGKAEPGRQNSIQRQTALKIASECIDINKHGLDALFSVADKFAAWLNEEKDAGESVPVVAQQPETMVDTTGVTENKLPF